MSNRFFSLSALAALALSPLVSAGPFIREEDEAALSQQVKAFLDAASTVTADASRGTVGVMSGRRVISYGTVIEPDLIATKLSEVKRIRNGLIIRDGQGNDSLVSVAKSFPEHDLALLRTEDALFTPVEASEGESQAGDLVFMARPDNVVFTGGVVSVPARSLRSEDQGFLGVAADRREAGVRGVGVNGVERGSAADLAGIRRGDRILTIEGVEINGFDEMSVVLKRRKPGDEVGIVVERGGKKLTKRATLTAYNEIRMPASDRFQRMEAMGTELSRKREGFSRVIQTDLDLRPQDAGSAIVNLDGKVIGIGIARASRIKSYVLPIDVVLEAAKSL